MATDYAYGNNTAWADTGFVGPCTIESQSSEALIHFGPTLPATYGAGPHHHLNPNEVPFYYSGIEKVFVRSANDNVSGITQTCKIVITND